MKSVRINMLLITSIAIACLIGCHSGSPAGIDASAPARASETDSVSDETGAVKPKIDGISPLTQSSWQQPLVNDASLVLISGGKPHEVKVGKQGVEVIVRSPEVPDSVRLNISGGAAVFVSDDGYFLTAEHLTRRQPMYACYIDDAGEARCDIVSFTKVLTKVQDREALVLGKINRKVRSLEISSDVIVGSKCVSVGGGFRGSKYSKGQILAVISAADTDAKQSEKMTGEWFSVYHNSNVGPGDSGGPLLNEKSQIIGINCRALVDTSGVAEIWAIRVSQAELSQILRKSASPN